MTLPDFHQRAARMLASPLTHPALLPRPHAQQLLRVWLAPSFTPAACWAWIRDGKQELLRRVVIDCKPSAMWEPVSYAAERSVAPGEFADLLDQLRCLSFPAFQTRAGIGIDGCRFGVDCGEGLSETRLSWWGSAPSGWEGLARWHAQAIARLNSGLPASTLALSLPEQPPA